MLAALMCGVLNVVRTRALLHYLRRRSHPNQVMLAVSTLLAVEYPRIISTRELVDYIYGDAPDGGPLSAHRCVHHAVRRLRARGLPIKTHGERGYSYDPAALADAAE
jgi:hypothetical protein